VLGRRGSSPQQHRPSGPPARGRLRHRQHRRSHLGSPLDTSTTWSVSCRQRPPSPCCAA